MTTLFPQETQYRVLTLWQPWASLLVYGVKKIETRPSSTSWTADKGVYLIHAASKWTKEQFDICLNEPFRSSLINIGLLHELKADWPASEHGKNSSWSLMLPLGQIIGAIEVTECHIIQVRGEQNPSYWTKDRHGNPDIKFVNDYKEIAFGDYREGRYAWLTQNPRILKTPIPYKGGQGYYHKFHGDIKQLEFI